MQAGSHVRAVEYLLAVDEFDVGIGRQKYDGTTTLSVLLYPDNTRPARFATSPADDRCTIPMEWGLMQALIR